MKIAVEGCAHGELEKIYDCIAHLEEREQVKVDLLICCGDFQATRNNQDLRCMAVPIKYQEMCSFYKYYSGEKKAPILTIFIGGNHEASNYLSELAYGGWAAPNIYYLGHAGVVNVGGVRIAGLSGIYKGRDYMKGHYEVPPYSEDTKRSVYHIRNLEVFRLKQVSEPVDIALSHDWPRGIYHHGDLGQLLRNKPFFREDIDNNSLGSQPAEELLRHLKPSYWFSAHLHCKFAALVRHYSKDEDASTHTTKFLALDKCLPKRRFLQIVDVPHDESKGILLEYDLEWLSILRLTNHLLSVKSQHNYMPGQGSNGRWIFTPTTEEKESVLQRFSGNLIVPNNFSPTVTPYNPSANQNRSIPAPKPQLNPQTMAFCDLLGVDDPLALLMNMSSVGWSRGQTSSCSEGDTVMQCPEAQPQVSSSSMDDSEGACEEMDESKSSPVFQQNRLGNLRLPSPCVPTSRLSGLMLPPPSCESGDDTANSSSTENPELSSTETPESSSTETPKLNPSPVEEPSPKRPILECRTPSEDNLNKLSEPKKFKRRNQALYSSTDDD